MNIKALLKSLLLRKFTTGLLILQLAITLGLLINSAILALDTNEKLAQDTGLDANNILIVSLQPTSGSYRDLDYFRSIVSQDLQALNNLSEVESVSLVNQLPINKRGMLGNVYDLDDPESVNRDKYLQDVKIFLTNEELSTTLGFELLEGRFLTKDDQLDFGSGENGNVIITESLKQALYGDESALGQETNNGRIVGVVKDIMLNPTIPEDKQYGMFGNRVMEYVFTARNYLVKVQPGKMDKVRNQVSDTILAVQAERDIYRTNTMAEHLKRFYRHDKGLAQ